MYNRLIMQEIKRCGDTVAAAMPSLAAARLIL